MPRHQQVTTCRKSGGPVSKHCSCESCTLSICEICKAGEGVLTTDCPGVKVAYARQQEVYETKLDYVDSRGWHQGDPTERRSPRFESTKLPPEPPPVDLRAVVAPSIDWTAVDRYTNLQYELAQKAVAWVIADREADDHSATLTPIEDEIDEHLQKDQEPNEHTRELLGKLEHAKIDFHLVSQRAEKCDDEFRQAARRLVAALEESAVTRRDAGRDG